jgi:hypothetical protein
MKKFRSWILAAVFLHLAYGTIPQICCPYSEHRFVLVPSLYKDLKKIETDTWNLILWMTASNLQTSCRHFHSDDQSLPQLFSLSDLSEQYNIM